MMYTPCGIVTRGAFGTSVMVGPGDGTGVGAGVLIWYFACSKLCGTSASVTTTSANAALPRSVAAVLRLSDKVGKSAKASVISCCIVLKMDSSDGRGSRSSGGPTYPGGTSGKGG